MPKTTSPEVENLIKARAKVQHHWIQHHFSMTPRYELCMPDDPRADCFCSLGAISAVTGRAVLTAYRSPEAAFLARAIGKKRNPLAIMAWNDDPERTFEEIIKGFDRAISFARAAARKAIRDKANAQPDTQA